MRSSESSRSLIEEELGEEEDEVEGLVGRCEKADGRSVLVAMRSRADGWRRGRRGGDEVREVGKGEDGEEEEEEEELGLEEKGDLNQALRCAISGKVSKTHECSHRPAERRVDSRASSFRVSRLPSRDSNGNPTSDPSPSPLNPSA